MSVVAVTGAAGWLGRRVVARALADADVERVIALDVVRLPEMPAHQDRLLAVQVDLSRDELGPLLDGAGTIVHLAFSSRTELDEPSARRSNVDGTRRLLDVADATGADHIIGLSHATAYGAWPNNALPLTEDAPLRPNHEFAYAVHKAQVELAIDEWGTAAPGRTTAVLRPCPALAEGATSWMAGVFAAGAGLLRSAEVDPPAQFVHLDDLADAVDLVRRDRLRGPFNVAPDGWVPGEEVRALAGSAPRPRLPVPVAAQLAEWSWKLTRGPIPPGLLAYTRYPWVVANDRLRAAGWQPANTNAEAYVAGTEGSWWSVLSPRRRQELALGVAGAGIAGAVGSSALAVRRALRSRS